MKFTSEFLTWYYFLVIANKQSLQIQSYQANTISNYDEMYKLVLQQGQCPSLICSLVGT